MAKCPICETTINPKAELVKHVETKHADKIPEEYEGGAAQWVYAYNHNGRKNGICRYCGKETPWNVKAGKPCQICGQPACVEKVRKQAQERMLRVYGKTTLLNDPEQQKKMLAARSISGVYKWSDGIHQFTYTGKYEKFIIEWLDTVMELNPSGIQMPGLVIPYDHDGKPSFWITDMYLVDFNLVVEIKDGGENPTEAWADTRHKEELKDNFMRNQTEFNYVKITHKNVMQLIQALTKIREKNLEESLDGVKSKTPVILINV